MAYYTRVRNQKGKINKQREREREREKERLIEIKQHAKPFNFLRGSLMSANLDE